MITSWGCCVCSCLFSTHNSVHAYDLSLDRGIGLLYFTIRKLIVLPGLCLLNSVCYYSQVLVCKLFCWH